MSATRGYVLTAAFVVVGSLPWVFAAAHMDVSFLYAGLCHQVGERTLHVSGDAMVVCSRCAGIHLGLVLGALVAVAGKTHRWLIAHGRTLVAVAIALNLMDWGWSVWMPLSHASRIVVGALFGSVATSFMLASLVAEWRRRAAIAPSSETLVNEG